RLRSLRWFFCRIGLTAEREGYTMSDVLNSAGEHLQRDLGMNMGDTLYEIRAGQETWTAIGDKVTRKPRFGFAPPGEPNEWLTVSLNVRNLNPQRIPAE